MTQKQQQLSFDKGITNVPSDVLCSDNALEESIGLVYDDGEHKVVQKPRTFVNGYSGDLSSGKSVIYVHSLGNEKRYIYTTPYDTQNVSLRWAEREPDDTILNYRGSLGIVLPKNSFSITSVGKTLVVNISDGIQYFLWSGTAYKALGELPTPEVRFWLTQPASLNECRVSSDYAEIPESVFSWNDTQGFVRDQDKFNNLVVGLYAELKNKVKKKRKFMHPFFALVALETFTGDYIMPTAPVLLWPTVRHNNTAEPRYERSSWDDPSDPPVANWGLMKMTTWPADLNVELYTNYSEYADVIKNVTVFITSEIDQVATGDDHKPQPNQNVDSIYDRNGYSEYVTITNSARVMLSIKRDIDIKSAILSATQNFYKIAEIPFGTTNLTSIIPEGVIENLKSQQQLEGAGFYDHTKMVAKNMFAYNSRLNLSGLSRFPFDGFKQFCSYSAAESKMTIYVEIDTTTGTQTVKKVVEYNNGEKPDKIEYWFFYPDTRAKRVIVFNEDDELIFTYTLKEHPYLHGAYYLGIPFPTDDDPTGTDPRRYQEIIGSQYNVNDLDNDVVETKKKPEKLYNTIATSEANNPWVFKAEGYNNVGNGEIIGVASLTQALSQGQFGQYPLLAFCSDGIWALSVGQTGYYTSIHPMSREVCNNPKSITQTDGAVFFSSEKGLMVVVGNQVKCVSEQMSGRNSNFSYGVTDMGNFRDYLKECFIAYDYRDSLLWIFNPESGFEEYCYLYAIKSGTFSKYFLDDAVDGVVGDYPDNLLRSGGKLFSLTGRENINDDKDEDGNVNIYSGVLISRPMKLENGLALKSLMQVKHIRDFAGDGTMTLKIYASNNLRTWVELKSLRGIPWKYYRFRYDFQNLLATDRFAGSVVVTQERRTDKLR